MEANNGYVLGALSYADITMAVAANAIEPLGPPISKCAFLFCWNVLIDMNRIDEFIYQYTSAPV